ncbi:ATP-binding protein, partial [Kitasatospora sp. NPDC093806]|uniref:ATP-binding protein n=1 Tax=Kitasatospora sp. NPDC093806 TaxID=3155075 RepID=UPI0034352C9B
MGRDRELARAADVLSRPPAVLVVEGEAGVGKSGLVAEAVRAQARAGRTVLTGRCHPLREPEPFGPVADALRDAAALLPPRAELPPSTGALGWLLPDLAPLLPAAPSGGDGLLSARRLLAQGVRALLAALDDPVLVIEDLHWADDATLDLLL